MSEERAEKFLELFNKGKEFTEELLRENQRLRYRLAALETEHGEATTEEIQRLRAEIQQLGEENRRIQQRFREVEEENKDFANRYIEIEEQNNNLANLYVASYQLHSTLDYKEVVRIVQEIVINLIGAEVFHLLMFSEKTHALEVETSEGQVPGRNTIPLGEGPIGKSAQTGENHFAESVARREPSPFEEPLAVIPLKIKDTVIGVITINKLLFQKTAFTTMDY